jgi:hypothetical protein
MAVFSYFDKKLSIQVNDSSGRIKVPVMWTTGERWKLIRKNKFRDDNGTLILPILSIKRSEIDRTPGFGGLGQEVPFITVTKELHPKTSNLETLYKTKKSAFPTIPKPSPIYEIFTIPYPDFCTIYYEISIWTQYESQMNEILEKIFYKFEHRDSFVMPVEYDGNLPKGNGYYFVGFRDGNIAPQSNTEEFTDQERIIKYSYIIKVPAYFILSPDDEALSYGRDKENKESTGKEIIYRQQSQNKISLKEKIVTLEEFKKLFG